jgi:uncharacterized protein (DUF1684 family)
MSSVGKTLTLLLLTAATTAAVPTAVAAPPTVITGSIRTSPERESIERWRSERLAELTSETGWLTLVGLFWLAEGNNTFGRAPANTLVLDHPALADTAGTFTLKGTQVTFTAQPGSGITQAGKPVTTIELISDVRSRSDPTVISSGSLRFFIIERSGKLAVRARDVESPRRRDFPGLQYFPITDEWAFDARFEPYNPPKRIPIVNVLGLEEDRICPGALVFNKDGQELHLDALLNEPDGNSLFVMFADATSGTESYGAGRYLDLPLASQGTVRLDFNKAYNPPCAFNNFATCPLPPYQNRLKLPVLAGEKGFRSEH